MSLASGSSQVTPWLYWTLFPIHRAFLRVYFSGIEIQGAEHLPAKGPVVLAAKHFSRWDPLVLSLLSRGPLRFMTNANQFGGVQGWFIKRLGAFPIDLAKPQLASLRHTIELLQQGHKLVLFPEGGIVRDRPLRDLKPGLARLVLQAEGGSKEPLTIPIVPIALRYVPDAMAGARILIHIGSPLYSQDYRGRTDKETAQFLTQALQAALLQGLSLLNGAEPSE